jgi:hypothetical protein
LQHLFFIKADSACRSAMHPEPSPFLQRLSTM